MTTARLFDLTAQRRQHQPMRCSTCGREVPVAPGFCEAGSCRKYVRRGKWLVHDPVNGKTIGELYP